MDWEKRVREIIAKAGDREQPVPEEPEVDLARIPRRFAGETLATIEPDERIEGQRQLLRMADAWLARFREGSVTRGLLLTGPTGSGKTKILSSLAQDISDPPCYWPMRDFASYIRRHLDEGDLEWWMNGVARMRTMILDDVGASRDESGFLADKAAEIIERRYDAMLPTHLATNLGLEDLRDYLGERSYSRLCEVSHHVELKGDDLRVGTWSG